MSEISLNASTKLTYVSVDFAETMDRDVNVTFGLIIIDDSDH